VTRFAGSLAARVTRLSLRTIYTVSYDTGSPDFYFDAEYFAKGGVTNGNLTAPSSTDINNQVLDNGVYNYGEECPNSSQYYANFWVDVVFSPSSSNLKTAAVAASPNGSATMATGRSGNTITSIGSATHTGPTGAAPGSQRTSSSTAQRPSLSLAVASYRPVVTQAQAPVLWGQKATSFLS
jgi:hypothetical protein